MGMKKPIKIFLVAGARPNFMKVAPILSAIKRRTGIFRPYFIHTGQHYDDKMSKAFLDDLSLPDPDVYLGVGSASHAIQTAKIMIAFEKAMLEKRPDLVSVVGDVNSTLACALVSAKLHVPIAHVEAGLRSRDRSMPEEINRIVADQLSNVLFTTCRDADSNLLKEGIPKEKIHFVGNVMIESLIMHQEKIDRSDILEMLKLDRSGYALVTLHRPSNVDNPETFKPIFKILQKLSERLPVVFPVHPRTKVKIGEFKMTDGATDDHRLILMEPLDYFDFLNLEKNARLVLTDSGGVQEETTFFGVPCITIRENTERPITVEQGTNTLAGTDPDAVHRACQSALSRPMGRKITPELWDENVSERIVTVLMNRFGTN